jgi:hypothetical protein
MQIEDLRVLSGFIELVLMAFSFYYERKGELKKSNSCLWWVLGIGIAVNLFIDFVIK